MNTRYRIVLCAIVCSFFLCSCKEEKGGRSFVGIGTVVLNDTSFAVRHYSSILYIGNKVWQEGLSDGSRVYFAGTGYDMAAVEEKCFSYSFEPQTLSNDITVEPLFVTDSIPSDSLCDIITSREGFYAQNIHITRDWQRNDFFDASAIYPGCGDGSTDFLGLVSDSLTVENDSLQVFWLRLCRAEKDSMQMITKHISIPINCLRDSTKERIYIRLKRFDAYGDTVVNDYCYSYINWVE